jgi:hypothetical protein
MTGCQHPRPGADAGARDLAGAPDLTVIVGVVCGSVRCATDADQFCDTGDFGQSGTCRAHTTPSATAYACDGPEDCPSSVCCRTPDGSACSAFGFCVAGSVKGELMCHTQDYCGMLTCCPLQPGVPYAVCREQC